MKDQNTARYLAQRSCIFSDFLYFIANTCVSCIV